MQEHPPREQFDTGMSKIRREIKIQLLPHGLYGTVTSEADASAEDVPAAATLELTVKGRKAARTFDRRQIEGCFLRVKGEVLTEIIAMVNEVSG